MIPFLLHIYRSCPFLLYFFLVPCVNCGKIETVQHWDDDNRNFLSTTQRPFPWRFTTIPNDKDYDVAHTSDSREVFVIVFVVLFFFALPLICLYLAGVYSEQWRKWSRVNTPRNYPLREVRTNPYSRFTNIISEFPTSDINPNMQSSTTTTTIRTESRPSDLSNLDPQVSSATNMCATDKPPDYSAVTVSDLPEVSVPHFPAVKPQSTLETPPPDYDGKNVFK